LICGQAERDWSPTIQGSKISIEGAQDKRCYLCGSLTEIGSFDSERKTFVLFLRLFRGPFFHKGFEWFLFVLFLSVLAFTHISRSLYLSLIGRRGKQRIAYRSSPPQAYTAASTTAAGFSPPVGAGLKPRPYNDVRIITELKRRYTSN
jgi:hypothetical protein